MHRRQLLQGAATLGSTALMPGSLRFAEAEGREDTLRVLSEGRPTSQDPHGTGVSAASYGVFVNTYDRLINFKRREVRPGLWRYDPSGFEGELAEGWEEQDEGRTLVFHLRRDATFHDGTAVTAEDVRWSLERGVTLPASKNQLGSGSLKEAGQFTVVDPLTIRITTPRRDRLTLPNLALSFASVLNSTLAKAHATAADPWATEWVRNNGAGGGAYRVDSWNPSQRVSYSRFDAWKSGPLPSMKEAVVEIVPTAQSRAATLLRGDADIALQLPPRDLDALRSDKRADLVSLPVTNAFRFLAFNTKQKPFDDVRVREAISYALPYRDLFQGSVFGHGTPLFGAAMKAPETATFPQPYPYDTDLDRARALLAEAGLGGGFATTFSTNVADATLADPIALLVQEGLGRIGITVTIDKVPEAQWGTLLTARKIPFYADSSSAWFDAPDYFFRIFFQGDWRWNFGNFDDPELDRIVEEARWEPDPARYDAAMKQAIAIGIAKLPIIPLWQPSFEAALKPGLGDFTYYIHGQVDFRPLRRA